MSDPSTSSRAEQPTHPAAVLFDHDGTLVDTEPLWAAAKEEIAEAHGAAWTEQDTLDCLGQPMSMTLDRLEQIGVDLPREELLGLLARTAQQKVAEANIEFLPGVADLLADLAEAGIPAAIVTNATSEVARATAARAPEGLVRTVIGNEDVSSPKPNPEPYLLAARRLGVPIEDCVAVEDSPSGAASASAAGARVVVVPGMQPVDASVGTVHLEHRDVTLAAIRALFA